MWKGAGRSPAFAKQKRTPCSNLLHGVVFAAGENGLRPAPALLHKTTPLFCNSGV